MPIKNNKKPAELGFRMPAEWEPHEATWLAWPHDFETWPKQMNEIEDGHIRVIEQLHLNEKVHILVDDSKTQDAVLKKLQARGITRNIILHVIPTNSIWIRDYGPMFLTQNNGPVSFAEWAFNGWGKKYPDAKDKQVPSKLGKILNIKPFRAEIVLEGGSIDVNGSGTLMTTEECLLNPNRNPHLKRFEIEQYLKDFLGVSKIIWLGKGLEGDDTDGHIDEVARFVAADKIVMNATGDANSYNGQVMADNWQRLKYETNQNGKPIELIELPMPAKISLGKMTLPGSYTNFYIGNKCVLIPAFGDKNDAAALSILKDLFPGRHTVQVSAIPLIYGQGAFHCMTQQEPAHAA